ncbi:MAG: DoxX family membrane protein [Nitrospirae bacterium]|nr:DoxX family membrane protein [Nitrospirota bacterium]
MRPYRISITETLKKIDFFAWLCLAIRVVIGTVFIYAGIVKLLDIKAFAHKIEQYDMVPDELLPVAAVALPVFETIAGLGLIFDIPGSLIAISSLLILFIAVLGYGILNDLDVDCGCFSQVEIANRGNLRQALYRDLFMVAAVLFLSVSGRVRTLYSQHSSLRGKLRLFKGGS